MGDSILPMPQAANASNETARNASVIYAGPDTAVHVQQGPIQLVQLAFNPPPWIHSVLSGVVAVVAILVVLGLIRHGIDEDVLSEMAEIVFIVVGILVATNLFGTFFDLPYLVDVIGGWLGGYALAQASIRGIYAGTERISTA